jgi:hypothetical protein
MDDAPHRLRAPILLVLALFLGGGLFFIALTVIGNVTRARVRDQDRYRFEFAAIECIPDPPRPPATFLSEVQFLGEISDELNLLEDTLAARLADAFRKHPWVEAVERVEITPDHHIQVRLRYRKPVLAVRTEGKPRAVDHHGILLPSDASLEGLPMFEGQAKPPGKEGQPWGDAAVERAAQNSHR